MSTREVRRFKTIARGIQALVLRSLLVGYVLGLPAIWFLAHVPTIRIDSSGGTYSSGSFKPGGRYIVELSTGLKSIGGHYRGSLTITPKMTAAQIRRGTKWNWTLRQVGEPWDDTIRVKGASSGMDIDLRQIFAVPNRLELAGESINLVMVSDIAYPAKLEQQSQPFSQPEEPRFEERSRTSRYTTSLTLAHGQPSWFERFIFWWKTGSVLALGLKGITFIAWLVGLSALFGRRKPEPPLDDDMVKQLRATLDNQRKWKV